VRFANNLGALGYGAPPLAPAKCVEVTFKHFAATVTEEQADMSEISAEQEGRIEVNPLILSISDRGKSKNVYKVSSIKIQVVYGAGHLVTACQCLTFCSFKFDPISYPS
jgi:hypothetical protein